MALLWGRVHLLNLGESNRFSLGLNLGDIVRWSDLVYGLYYLRKKASLNILRIPLNTKTRDDDRSSQGRNGYELWANVFVISCPWDTTGHLRSLQIVSRVIFDVAQAWDLSVSQLPGANWLDIMAQFLRVIGRSIRQTVIFFIWLISTWSTGQRWFGHLGIRTWTQSSKMIPANGRCLPSCWQICGLKQSGKSIKLVFCVAYLVTPPSYFRAEITRILFVTARFVNSVSNTSNHSPNIHFFISTRCHLHSTVTLPLSLKLICLKVFSFFVHLFVLAFVVNSLWGEERGQKGLESPLQCQCFSFVVNLKTQGAISGSSTSLAQKTCDTLGCCSSPLSTLCADMDQATTKVTLPDLPPQLMCHPPGHSLHCMGDKQISGNISSVRGRNNIYVQRSCSRSCLFIYLVPVKYICALPWRLRNGRSGTVVPQQDTIVVSVQHKEHATHPRLPNTPPLWQHGSEWLGFCGQTLVQFFVSSANFGGVPNDNPAPRNNFCGKWVSNCRTHRQKQSTPNLKQASDTLSLPCSFWKRQKQFS